MSKSIVLFARLTHARPALGVSVVGAGVLAASVLVVGKPAGESFNDRGVTFVSLDDSFAADSLTSLFLQEIGATAPADEGAHEAGGGHRLEDLAYEVHRVEVSALPASILEIQRAALAQGVSPATWNEILTVAVMQIGREPRTEARDRILGPAVNHLANSWVWLSLKEDDLELQRRAMNILRYGIDEADYAPAKVSAGRLYAMLCMTFHGNDADEAVHGLRSSNDAFLSLPDGPAKELVRGTYVNAATHLARALASRGDHVGAFSQFQSVLGDEKNLRHISDPDGLASTFCSMAISAIKTGDLENASVGIGDTIEYFRLAEIGKDRRPLALVDPLAAQYDLACRFEREFRGEGLDMLSAVSDELFRRERVREGIVATLELAARSLIASQDERALAELIDMADFLIDFCSLPTDPKQREQNRKVVRDKLNEITKISSTFTDADRAAAGLTERLEMLQRLIGHNRR